jgi:hypothetical protein
MLSNFKKLTDSLSQAQEQARQQFQKSQNQPSRANTDNRPDTDPDPTYADDAKQEDTPPTVGDETVPSTPDKKDPSLPKDVRIKLAKLAKYEDRHPSTQPTAHKADSELQAAYKDSQGRIASFERVLRERTPLGGIDEVEDFASYLDNLTARTEVLSLGKGGLM